MHGGGARRAAVRRRPLHMTDPVDEVRRQMALTLDELSPEEALALAGELLVYTCLDGATTVEESDALLAKIRSLFAHCKGPGNEATRMPDRGASQLRLEAIS